MENVGIIKFKSCFDKNGQIVSLKSFLENIKKTSKKDLWAINNARRQTDKRKLKYFKSKLSAYQLKFITDYGYRNGDIKTISNMVVMDFDDVSNNHKTLELIKREVSQHDFVVACFISPSNKGLKVLVSSKVNNESHYKDIYEDLSSFMETKHKIKADRSQSGIRTLCFISYDPNIYINYNAKNYEPRKS